MPGVLIKTSGFFHFTTKEKDKMYFTDTPSLNHMEAIMKQPPGYRQRGGGSKRKSYQYTKADCSCRLCLHYQKNSGCTALICPVIDIRLKCGTASFNEAVKYVFKEVNHAAFQRRLNKYIYQIKGGDFMLFRNNRHMRIRQNIKPLKNGKEI